VDGTAKDSTSKDVDAAAKDGESTAKDAKSAATASGKDPVGPKGRNKGKGKNAGKDSAAGRTPGGEVAEKAKDSTRRTSVRRAAQAESARTTGRRVAAAGQNPQWLAPTAVVLLILGLAYLVTYYISAGQLPLPISDWNLAVGFGVLMVGGGMLMFWK
jgi:uncharacterized membrane protein